MGSKFGYKKKIRLSDEFRQQHGLPDHIYFVQVADQEYNGVLHYYVRAVNHTLVPETEMIALDER